MLLNAMLNADDELKTHKKREWILNHLHPLISRNNNTLTASIGESRRNKFIHTITTARKRCLSFFVVRRCIFIITICGTSHYSNAQLPNHLIVLNTQLIIILKNWRKKNTFLATYGDGDHNNYSKFHLASSLWHFSSIVNWLILV